MQKIHTKSRKPKNPDYEKDLVENIFQDAFGVDFDFVIEAVKEKLERCNQTPLYPHNSRNRHGAVCKG